MRKMLVQKEHPEVQPIAALMAGRQHTTLVLWAMACAPHVLELFEARHPHELRPRQALETMRQWARGEIKMPVAKRAILACHSAATGVGAMDDPAGEAAARAIGHAAATVHVQTHAIGLVLYGVTAFAYASPDYPADSDAIIARECAWYFGKLEACVGSADNEPGPWAPFLIKKKV